jgi:hypothetical protein
MAVFRYAGIKAWRATNAGLTSINDVLPIELQLKTMEVVMRKSLLIVMAMAGIGGAVVIESTAQAQPYGRGMMGGYGGYGYGMMGGYGPGYMMGPGYGPGYMMGPGYDRGDGYGSQEDGYQRGSRYRGQRLCWQESDSTPGGGYYVRCPN